VVVVLAHMVRDLVALKADQTSLMLGKRRTIDIAELERALIAENGKDAG
jgi:hypothetical protein